MIRRRTPTLLALLVALLFVPTAFGDDEPSGSKPDDGENARTKEIIEEMRALVSEIRGLEWKQPVPAGLITRTQVRERMVEQAKKELPEDELRAANRILRRMGMLGEDENILMLYLDMISGGGLGFYDPDEKQLFIVDGQDPESLRPTIVHELTHALEDQYIDLKTTQESMENDPDRLFAFKCMIEGSAETATEIYEDRFPEEAKLAREGQRGNAELQEGMRTMARMPAYLMVDTLLHYRTGPDFVGKALGDTAYCDGIDPLYADQPVSQEQVLHPRKFLTETRDYPQTVVWGADLADAAGEAWTNLDEMSQGELDLALWLDYHLGLDEGRLAEVDMARGTFVVPLARQAAEGWDAGRMMFLDKGGEQLAIVGAFAFDTRRDAQEAFDAILATLKMMHGAGWSETARQHATDEADRAAVDYETPHGKSRLVREGDKLFLLDGLPKLTFDAVWPGVAATTFVRDARDTWDAENAADPFAGFQVVDRQRGIGVQLPNDSWKENEQLVHMMRSANPALVTEVSRASIKIRVMTVDQGSPKSALLDLVKGFLGPAAAQVDLSNVREHRVMGENGLMIEISPPGSAGVRRLYAGTDGERTTLAVLEGRRDDVTNLAGEIDAVVGGIKSILSY